MKVCVACHLLSAHLKYNVPFEIIAGSKGASTKNNPPEANDNQQSVKYVSVAGDFSDKLSLVNKVEQHEDTVKQNIKSADNEVDKNANGDPSLTSG